MVRAASYGSRMVDIYFTDDPEANRLLAENHFALLVGLVLHQQIPTEKAFRGPYDLQQRLSGELDASTIARLPPDELEELFRERPALHRFPANMAKRTQAVAEYLDEHYAARPENVWAGVAHAEELMQRLEDLPGFGEYKARIYLGVLAERFEIRPRGWEEYLPTWPSIVDVATAQDLVDLKARKAAWKKQAGS